MIKSYRMVIAVVFLVMSLWMLKSRLSISTPVLESSPKLEALGVEEKEVLFAAIERLAKQPHSSSYVAKINHALNQQDIPVWVVHSSLFSDSIRKESKLIFADNVGLIIPEQFFQADPFTQEAYLSTLTNDIEKSDLSAVAKIFKPKAAQSHDN